MSGQKNKKERRFSNDGSDSESGSCSDSDSASAEPPGLLEDGILKSV